MDWLEIKIKIDNKHIDEAAAIAQMLVSQGIYVEDYSDLEIEAPKMAHVNLIDEELLKKDKSVGIIHVYVEVETNPKEAIGFLEERLSDCGIGYEIEVANVSEIDWENAWKKYFHPIKLTDKLTICPSWETVEQGNSKILKIDPGMAFGTGTHETTQLVIEEMDEYLNEATTIFDIGCGSGILSIAGMLLGAKEALGIDIDLRASKIAKENAEINGLDSNIDYICGNILENNSEVLKQVKGKKFNMILANIIAEVIVPLNKNIKDYMTEDGVYIMSGIINHKLASVVESLDENGFEIVKISEKNDWRAVVAKIKK